MGQNSVTPVLGLTSALPTAGTLPTSTTAQQRQFNSSVAEAVRTVNDSGYLGSDREVTFSVDQATRLAVVKVVDTSTNEVLEQWPPEYLLQIAAETKNLMRDSG